MHESRLFQIVYYLLEKGKSTAPELAEKFEVSVRTIYRDIDAISSAGIPIYASPGKGGGIALLDHFVLDRSLFTEQEREQVLMALQGLAAAGQRAPDDLLTKLGGLFQAKNTNWIEVDFSDWVQSHTGQDHFQLIKNAVFSRSVLAFRYFSGSGAGVTRHAEPLRLVFKSKAWYLYAFCRLRNDFRFFKLSRMRDIETLSETFTREAPASCLSEKPAAMQRTVPVTLKFDRRAAFRVYDEFAGEVTEDEQGNLYVKTQLPDSGVLYSYLFSFADAAEIIEPAYLRQEVKEKLSAMQKKYIT